MKKIIVFLVVATLGLFGGVALADDPDGDIQSARDLLAQADALLAAEQAKPPMVTTVTETATVTTTATVTETVTATVTETVTQTSSPPPPAPSCTGTQVAPGSGLKAAMDAAPAGTTFCLSAGTYTVNDPITTQVDDRVIGAGRDATFIDGTGLEITDVGIFSIGGASYFEEIDIFGAPMPEMNSGTFCAPDQSRCGRAFHTGSQALTLQSLDCHDNDGNCVGGGGSAKVVIDDIECFNNGSNYSMSSSATRSAACVKRAANYASGGDTTVTNSYIHDNGWVGVWCDFCKFGTFRVENNVFEDNGARGVQWEMSGGWSAEDNAIIRGNTFHGNGWRTIDPAGNTVGDRGGILTSTSNDILVENNIFGGNLTNAVFIRYSAGRNPPQPDSRGTIIRNNTLNGDTINACGLAGVTCSGNTA